MKEITAYETSDGRIFTMKNSAEHHEDDLSCSQRANALLEDGVSIYEAYRLVRPKALSIPEILKKVTKDTKLSISHWQCRDEAGYMPKYFDTNMEVFVHGNTGSWSGSYGSMVSLADLASYATHKNTVFG